MKPYSFLATIAATTALLGAFASYRFTRAGEWLPRPPDAVGMWSAAEVTVPPQVLGLLGNPKASSFVYRSPFANRPPLPEEVQVSLVAAGPFENYHDPTVCVGEGAFRLTATKTIPLDGPNSGKVRVMIFRHRTIKPVRIVMYYWQQNRDGTTDSEPRMGSYRDLAARFTTGFGAVVQGRQTVIVRNFMMFAEDDDPGGVHAQRAVHEVSQALYRAFKTDGAGS
jgi:hypothetical protein